MSTPTQDTGGDSSQAGGGGGYSASNEGSFGDTTFGAITASGPHIVFPAPVAPISQPIAPSVSVQNSSIVIVGVLAVVAFALYLIFGKK